MERSASRVRAARRRRVVVAIAAALTLFLVAEDAFARRFGGFSGRSFSRSFSSSRSLGSSRSFSRSSSRRSLSGSRASTATARSNTRGVSQSNYNRARQQGTTFQSRSQAESAFRQRNASQYPSKYASQPSTRPSHIPQTTRVNGQTVNVNYNAGLGGYGYFMGGRWLLYSAMADAAMLSVLMSRNHYYYGAAPGAYVGGYSGGFWTGILLIGIIVALYLFVRSAASRGSTRYYDD